jgi:biopolymer transport protein ExbB
MLKTCRRRVVEVDVAVRARGRPVRAGLAVLVVMGGVLLSGPCSRVIAQERGSPPTSAPTKPGGLGVSVGTTSGNDEADAAAGIDDGKSGTPRVDAQESFLSWMARASGWIGLVIALMSFYLIALIVWMAQRYRPTIAVPRELISDVQNLLEQAKYNDAYHRLVSDSSFLARVLAAGVRKLPSGLSHAQRAMELANEDVTMEMEHRTTYLATVGTLGPMIGLVGTVYGMILSFRVIAVAGSSPQASQLAAGISTALFATLEGIGVSIPAIFFYALFRNRIARLSLEVGMTAEPLLEQFAAGVRMTSAAQGAGLGSGPAASPGAAPSPPAHAHPFAVGALTAASGQRPALPG